MSESAVASLREDPDPYVRYHAIERLADPDLRSQEVLEALVQALADPGYWEIPEPGAPSHLYSVAVRAREALLLKMPEAFEVFEPIAHRSPAIAAVGAELYRAAGERGERQLREAVRGSQPELSRAALNELIDTTRDSKTSSPENLRAILEALLHEDVFVRSNAMSYLPYYYQAHPEERPQDLVDDEFVEQLAQAIVCGRVQMETGRIFIDDPRILQAWVSRVGQGSHTPSSYNLLSFHLDRLNEAQVQSLIEAPLHPYTLAMLGDLKDRAHAAIPRLVEALEEAEKAEEAQRADAAAVALLKIRGGYQHVRDRLADQFMRDETSRQAIATHHPDPEVLAAEVIPRLKERWRTTKNLGWLRGMKDLGPLMIDEEPWLCAFLKKSGVDEHARSYAISIVATWGERAIPLFPQLRVLLDVGETRGTVLRALITLGPIARLAFLERLEELDQQSTRWLVWQANSWRNPLTEALASLRRETTGAQKNT